MAQIHKNEEIKNLENDELKNPDGNVVPADEEQADGAIQHLIFHSFYPLTCMVPLGDDFITINEKVPEFMKTKSNDTLLQETIKTFHGLMQEKDDEILNLRRQIKEEDSGLIKMTSVNIQTDLTLNACDEMERKLTELSETLPSKVEQIYQLELEKTKLEKLLQGNSVSGINVSKTAQLEEELNDSLKNLMELEEGNLALSNENKDLKQGLIELKWQLDEINDLKVEVELAKIQTEDELTKMKEILQNKDLLLEQLNNNEEKIEKQEIQKDTAEPSYNGDIKNVSLKEFEIMQENYEKQIAELEKYLNDARNNVEKEYALSELIDKVKENVFNQSSSFSITDSLIDIFPQHADKLGSSDIEPIDQLLSLSVNGETSEDDLKKINCVLNAIQYNENGETDKIIFYQRYNEKQDFTGNTKDDLQQNALNLGLTLKLKSVLLKMDIMELKQEYLKFEAILNLLNRSFKLTPLIVLNKMAKQELMDGILGMKSCIYEICMHSFWDYIFHQSLENLDRNRIMITMNLTDRNIFTNLLFPSFVNVQGFQRFLVDMKNVREVLLVGETAKLSLKPNPHLQLLKIQGVNVCRDVSSHLLPMFPKEVRYLLMGRSVEDTVCHENNLLKSVSVIFMKTFGKTKSDIFTVLIDVFTALDFENEVFTISSKSSSAEYKLSKLSVSSVANKIESTVIRVGVNKNIKDVLIRKLSELQKIINILKDDVTTESFKRKPENELLKDLIEKKEALLKMIFKDSFSPNIEKLSLNKGSTYFSCVSKERISLDYWMKILLDKYRVKVTNRFKELTVEEIGICITRLTMALKTVYPSFDPPDVDLKKNKMALSLMIVKYRKMLKCYIDDCFLGVICKRQFGDYIEEPMKQDQKNESSLENKYQTLKGIFTNKINNKEKLEDVLQRLYDVDCEIYPGIFDQDIEKRDFSAISDEELFDEILKLRLSIAAFVITPLEGTSDSDKTHSDILRQFKTLKEIETNILKIDPDVVDASIMESEFKILKTVIGKLKKKKKIDEEKLKTCFLALKKIESNANNRTFDPAMSCTEFDKKGDNNQKRMLVLNEAERILNVAMENNSLKNNGDKLCDGYRQVEELLTDIETKITKNDEKVKGTWTYMVWGKTDNILNIISRKEADAIKVQSCVRDNFLNNLDDIEKYVITSSDWRRNCLNRLNNLLKKFNSTLENRNIHISQSENSDMTDNFELEKSAFEKAFTQLEERFNELSSSNRKDHGKVSEIDLERNSNDELKNIILALEKEMSREHWTKSDEVEAKEWLDTRNREQLMDDCNSLMHKSLIVKIENLLSKNNEKEKETDADRPIKENQLSHFEDDINSKLAKYEELCNTVEKLKMPETQLSRRTGSTNQLFTPDTSSRRRNELTPLYDQQMNSRRSYSPSLRPATSQSFLPQNNDDDIDFYFQQKLDELQKLIRSSNNATAKDKEWLARQLAQSGSEVVVDGFDIEDEKTPRYYSMKLQDIQHERREDEMNALLHHIEKHRSDLVTENENLQQQLYASKSMQENHRIRLETFEKTEDLLRRKLSALESSNAGDSQKALISEEIQLLKQEKQRLTKTMGNTQKRMDQLNSEMVSLASSNSNLQHENHNVIIKNQYLERSIKKMEDLYEELVQQLSYCKDQPDRPSAHTNHINEHRDSPVKETDTEHKLRLTERDKIELVKKLDIIDQQNKLLRRHCEKLSNEVSELTRKLAEAYDQSDTYLRQNQQLSDLLDSSKDRFDSSSQSNSLRNKDDEIKNLRNKILHLETRMVSTSESPSSERLKQELISNKDKEITRLVDQLGSLQDRIDETKAQLEVKEYENRKLQSLTKQLQNQVSEDAYFPPPGYKLVKDL